MAKIIDQAKQLRQTVHKAPVPWPTIFSVALFPIIVLVDYLLARSEERQVLEQFGDEYRAYRRRVPMFSPRLSKWRRLLDGSSPTVGREKDQPR